MVWSKALLEQDRSKGQIYACVRTDVVSAGDWEDLWTVVDRVLGPLGLLAPLHEAFASQPLQLGVLSHSGKWVGFGKASRGRTRERVTDFYLSNPGVTVLYPDEVVHRQLGDAQRPSASFHYDREHGDVFIDLVDTVSHAATYVRTVERIVEALGATWGTCWTNHFGTHPYSNPLLDTALREGFQPGLLGPSWLGVLSGDVLAQLRADPAVVALDPVMSDIGRASVWQLWDPHDPGNREAQWAQVLAPYVSTPSYKTIVEKGVQRVVDESRTTAH